jgi:hypothetical protein
MFSLQDLLGQEQGEQAVSEISNTVGADSSMVNTAIQMALPALINGLANNASTSEGAESLNTALEEDHSGGGVLDNLGGLAGMIFGGQQEAAPPPPQANAGGILGHILGANQGAVAQEVSQKSGLNIGQVAQILMFLAPIVMSYLGQKKQQENVGADGLGGLLGSILGGGQQAQAAAPQSSGNAIIDMASNMLDSDRDGSAMDDIASMAFNYITKK